MTFNSSMRASMISFEPSPDGCTIRLVWTITEIVKASDNPPRKSPNYLHCPRAHDACARKRCLSSTTRSRAERSLQEVSVQWASFHITTTEPNPSVTVARISNMYR